MPDEYAALRKTNLRPAALFSRRLPKTLYINAITIKSETKFHTVQLIGWAGSSARINALHKD